MNKLLLKATALSIALFGAIGVQTFTSCSGDDGSDGAPGVQGEPGAPGAAGAAGSQGEPGAPGITPECKDGFWYNGTVKTTVSCTAGAPGENCTNADKGATIEITCGTNTVVIPKAMCGAVAYDPSKQVCDLRDGKMYNLVTIGEQIWTATNMNYAAPNSKCYDNSQANCTKYGRLYDYETALTVCPAGLHLPDTTELNELIEFAGGAETAGKKLKATTDWQDYTVEGDPDAKSGKGTDDFVFTALPGGNGNANGTFSNLGTNGHWWTATDNGANSYGFYILNNNEVLATHPNYPITNLFSVRCIKD